MIITAANYGHEKNASQKNRLKKKSAHWNVLAQTTIIRISHQILLSYQTYAEGATWESEGGFPISCSICSAYAVLFITYSVYSME